MGSRHYGRHQFEGYRSAVLWMSLSIHLRVVSVDMRTIVTIETIYTPIALPSCDRVCIDFQWLL